MLRQVSTWTGLFFAVMPLIEYASHRFVLHKPLFGKNGASYQDHHIDHHHRGMNESIHLDVHVLQRNNLLPIAAILLTVYLIGGIVAALTWLCCLTVYGEVWGQIHREAHGLGSDWIAKTWYGKEAIKHHLIHHENPKRNYGTVFPFTDWIFGTKQRSKA